MNVDSKFEHQDSLTPSLLKRRCRWVARPPNFKDSPQYFADAPRPPGPRKFWPAKTLELNAVDGGCIQYLHEACQKCRACICVQESSSDRVQERKFEPAERFAAIYIMQTHAT